MGDRILIFGAGPIGLLLMQCLRRGGAAHVTVTLAFQPSQVWLLVEDDGRGFDPEQVLQRTTPGAGWGLLGMKERASLIGGQVEIDSTPGKGTRITTAVPLGESR